MAVFSSESAVREKFQLSDTVLVPSTLITVSIDDAHLEVLRALDPQFDVPTPDDEVVLGETFLAGSHVLRSLSSKHAFEQKDIVVGGKRISGGRRFEALQEAAEDAATRAWETLEPFILPVTARKVADVTDTTPVWDKE